MEDLKEMIIQTLDAQGVLDKIRAQLRLNVFKAVQNEEAKVTIEKTKAINTVSSPDGKIAAALFKEFLEYFKMKYSLNVFVPECHFKLDQDEREFLQQELGISGEPGIPLIFTMLKKLQEAPQEALQEPSQEPSQAPQPKSAAELVQPPDILSGSEQSEDPPGSSQDEIEEERQRLMDIEKRIKEMEVGDFRQYIEIEGKEDQSPRDSQDQSFYSDILDEFDVVENAQLID